MTLFADEIRVVLELVPVAALADEGLVHQALGHDHMRQCGHDGHVGARTQRQVMGRLDMRRFHRLGAARVDHDQLGALAQALLHAAGKDRVRGAGIGADHHDHVRFLDRVEVLRAGRGTIGLAQPVTGGRVADAGAGIGVVVLEHRAGQLLHEVGFLVRAARRGDDADRLAAMLVDQALHAVRGEGHRLFPRHFFPRIRDLVADHRVQDAFLVRGIAIGEAALDAAMAAVRLAVLVRHHADEFIAAHFRLERAADAAIGAGGDDRTLGRADLDDRFLDQRGGRAGLHAGAAAHAIGRQEAVGRGPGGHAAVKAPPLDRQREGALHLFAGPHAARADDAFGRIVVEIRVRRVLGHVLRVGVAVVARAEMGIHGLVTHVAQTHGTGHVLQLAIAVGRAGQAVQRVIRDVKLHHPFAQALDGLGLGVDVQPLGHRRGARGRRAVAAVDLHKAQAARAESIDAVGRAELGNLDPGHRGGAHDRGALGHGDFETVDGQRDLFLGFRGGRAVVTVVPGNDEVLHWAFLPFEVAAGFGWRFRISSDLSHSTRSFCRVIRRPPSRWRNRRGNA
eukprot:m.23135 g.23135  ORF g.23135 m.23135 type:complete len:565 (+) comp9442_c0_seq1:265-1959(+)